MGGSVSSVFFIAIVAAIVVVAAGLNSILLIPIAVIAIGALIFVPLLRKGTDAAIAQKEAAPSGTATTREASYDPTDDAR